MSSTCLWHACRALCAGLLLMLLGAAMATIGYYADTLSVAEEIRGNATISVKDEARGFHLNNLSYAGPIVMGFGGFIVVAACVMTFEARDSAAKVTPARPQTMPIAPRRGPQCAAPARLDQLGVYRLPQMLPLPHALPLAPLHTHRHHRDRGQPHVSHRTTTEKAKGKVRFGSAPDLRAGSTRAPLSVTALRRPLRRYALSVDEPPQSALSASAVESECGSRTSLALDLHASGGAVTLRVKDNTRRRPLARQRRTHEDDPHHFLEDPTNVNNTDESTKTTEDQQIEDKDTLRLRVDQEVRASSAPLPMLTPPPSPRFMVTSPSFSVTSPPVSKTSPPDTCVEVEGQEPPPDP